VPNRIIKESIKRSPEIDKLSWFEEVVFYRLIVTADDFGRLDGRMVVLKNDLFPTKDTITRKSVEDAVNKLVSVGLLVPYVDAESDMPYLFFRRWDKHQTVRNKYSKYPSPPDDLLLQANCKQSFADCNQVFGKCCDESESKIESESESKTDNAHTRDGDCTRFVDFWKIYPNKVKKSAAIAAWKSGKCEKIADTIIADVQRRCDTEWKGDGAQYVPHPTTYIHQRRWEDETPPHERKEGHIPQKNPALNYEQREYSEDDFSDLFMFSPGWCKKNPDLARQYGYDENGNQID